MNRGEVSAGFILSTIANEREQRETDRRTEMIRINYEIDREPNLSEWRWIDGLTLFEIQIGIPLAAQDGCTGMILKCSEHIGQVKL